MFVIAVDSARGLLPKSQATFEAAWQAAVEFLRKDAATIWHSSAEECFEDQLSFNDAQTMNWAVGQPSVRERARGPTMIYEIATN